MVAALIFLVTGHASDELLDERYSPELNPGDQVLVDMIEIAIKQALFDDAIDLSTDLLASVTTGYDADSQIDNPTGYSPDVIGQIMVNHGIIYFTAERYQEALAAIEQGLLLIEQQHKTFSEKLVPGLTAKGVVEMSLKQYKQGEDTFHRAQHIIHREQGVTSEHQLELVQRLVSSNLWQNREAEADNLQMFSLHIAEKSWGANGVELLPTLLGLGFYFSERSYTSPAVPIDDELPARDVLFRRALAMYNRSIDIIEQTYGPNDIRLVQPLRGLGKTRMRNLTSRNLAHDAYNRAYQIIDEYPGADDADRAKALVDLGDLHTVMRNRQEARGYYLKAWQLLQETEEMQDIANNLFGAPRQLHPLQKPLIRLERKPDAAAPGAELSATLNYSVEADGKVRNIEVIERNVPNAHIRALRQTLSKTLFRPRIAEGELVATADLTLYQRYVAPRDSSDDTTLVTEDSSSPEETSSNDSSGVTAADGSAEPESGAQPELAPASTD